MFLFSSFQKFPISASFQPGKWAPAARCSNFLPCSRGTHFSRRTVFPRVSSRHWGRQWYPIPFISHTHTFTLGAQWEGTRNSREVDDLSKPSRRENRSCWCEGRFIFIDSHLFCEFLCRFCESIRKKNAGYIKAKISNIQYSIGFGRILSDSVGFRRIWSDSVGFHQILIFLVDSVRLCWIRLDWSDLARFGQTLSDFEPW